MPCYSIIEAHRILEEQKRRVARNTTGVSKDSVNIVAVVVNRSIRQSPAVSPAATAPKVDFWISDQSLSHGAMAKVTLFGSQEVARVEDEQIHAGDILRFNGLCWSRYTDNGPAVASFTNSKEPGSGWCRLGHIDADGSFASVAKTRMIPRNMTTPQDRIQDLSKWYQRRSKSHPAVLVPAACVSRSLREIQGCVGLVSHIVVRVTDVDIQPATPSPRRKRKRNQSVNMIVAFATVIDETGVVMTMVDPGNKFGVVLRSAMVQGNAVRISNVASKKSSDIHGRHMPTDEVVLWPTMKSVAKLATGHSLISESSRDQGGHTSNYQITLESHIVDLSVRGVALSSCLHNRTTFLDAVMTPSRKYAPAMILLDPQAAGVVWSTSIHAPEEILQMLCGGLDPEEVLGDATLGQQVMTLLKAMLHERVLLRWTIIVRNGSTEIIRVVLPSL